MTALLAALGVLLAAAREAPRCDLSLISRVGSIQPGLAFEVALKFKIEPGWHIYWQNAGDTGVPTNVDWKLPPGFKVEYAEWSRPHRMETAGIISFGFEDEAFLVATLRAPAKINSASVKLAATADWLICKESCIIGKGTKSLTLPVKKGAAQPTNPAVWNTVLFALPNKHRFPITASAEKGFYEIKIGYPRSAFKLPTDAYFFAKASDVVEHAKPQTLRKTENGAILRVPRSSYEKGPAKFLEGVLELGQGEAQNVAYAIRIPITNVSTVRRSSP